jgi:hypothetical protein
MLLTFHPNLDNHRRLKKVVEIVQILKDKDTPVIICPEWFDLGFTYYYNQKYFRDYGNLRLDLQHELIFPVNHPEQISKNIIDRSASLILVEEWPEVADKNNEVLKKISDKFSFSRGMNLPETYKIYYFIKK